MSLPSFKSLTKQMYKKSPTLTHNNPWNHNISSFLSKLLHLIHLEKLIFAIIQAIIDEYSGKC
jgi:hypothetical protein